MTHKRELELIETLSSCENIGLNAKEHFDLLQKTHENFKIKHSTHEIITILNALGNPDRFFIIELLQEQDRCGCEIESALDKSQPSISRHIKILENVGLIRGWRKGKFTHYSLIRPTFDKIQKFLTQWISKVENWLV